MAQEFTLRQVAQGSKRSYRTVLRAIASGALKTRRTADGEHRVTIEGIRGWLGSDDPIVESAFGGGVASIDYSDEPAPIRALLRSDLVTANRAKFLFYGVAELKEAAPRAGWLEDVDMAATKWIINCFGLASPASSTSAAEIKAKAQQLVREAQQLIQKHMEELTSVEE